MRPAPADCEPGPIYSERTVASDAGMNNQAHRRREVRFRGRVQGVGFRATTCDVAQRFAVVGYVENLPNGQVSLVAEGESAELDRFICGLADEMKRYVAGYDVDDLPATGEFDDFHIRH